MIKNFPGHKELPNVYVNYGSCVDEQGNGKKAISIYEDGLKLFPGNYLLWYNKAITEYRMGQYDDAVLSAQNALTNNPLHPSSHNLISVVEQSRNRIPSALAAISFLLIEHEGKRAVSAFERLQKLLYGNISRSESGTINISISADPLNKKKKENDFSMVEFTMSLPGAVNLSDSLKNQHGTDKLARTLDMLASSLGVNKSNNGFYWKHYAPFFRQVKEKGFSKVVAHLCYVPTDDDANKAWLDINRQKVADFYEWLKTYNWKAE